MKFIWNFPLGLFLGSSTTLLLCLLIDVGVREVLGVRTEHFFTVFAILIASAITLIGVRTTLEQRDKEVEFSRQRKLAAARALLPTALSRFCVTCMQSCRFVHRTYLESTDADRLNVIRGNPLGFGLDEEVITVFKEILEFVEDDEVSQRIQLLLREYQVFSARTGSLVNGPSERQDHYLRELIVGWAYAYGITSTLFDYARGESDFVDNDAFSVTSGLSASGVADDGHFANEISLYSRTFARRSRA